jgi:ABC-2 type transport system ATP-binding protein
MSNFKVKKIFELASDFFQNWDEEFKNELVAKFKLDINKKYITLSKGTAAIEGIIIGLASRSELTIYDEAYLGLDAAARKLFYDILLEDYIENPRTIIFSTHLIDEVSNLFEEIIKLHNGKILLKEETDIIKNKFNVSKSILKEDYYRYIFGD